MYYFAYGMVLSSVIYFVLLMLFRYSKNFDKTFGELFKLIITWTIIAFTFMSGAFVGQAVFWNQLKTVDRVGNNLFIKYTKNPIVSPFLENHLSLALNESTWKSWCSDKSEQNIRTE